MSGFNLPPGVSPGDIPGNQWDRDARKRAARRAGEKKYHSWHPCKHCGGTERYLSSDACVPCSLQRARRKK